MSSNLRRRFAAFAACVVAAIAPAAMGQTTLTLNTEEACVEKGATTLTVTVDLTGATDTVVGGEFFLQYNTDILEFVSAEPGGKPFVLELFEAHDADAGTIDYAVGVLPKGGGTTADSTMAVLTFTILDTTCPVELVWFRDHDPPTRVTNDEGENHLAAANDLESITVGDKEPPVLTLTSGLTATDECADAPTLPGLGTYQFSTLGATASSGGVGDCGTSEASPDVWYMLVSPVDATLAVRTCGFASYDTVLEALTACDGEFVDCNDDTCDLQSSLTLVLRAHVPVLLRISGYDGDAGDGFISVRDAILTPPRPDATDVCTDAKPFGEGVFPFDTTAAKSDIEGLCDVSADAPDAWIQYVPTTTGIATATTCGYTDLDTVLSVHTAPCGDEIDCNDDLELFECFFQSGVTFKVTKGEPVWVRIAGYDGKSGAGSVLISLEPTPPAPPFTLDRIVKADPGACSAIVTYGATATDNCDPKPLIECNFPSGFAFPIGTTTVECSATDACGGVTFESFDVTVLDVSEMVADVELAGSDPGEYSRCITFEFIDPSSDCPDVVSVNRTLWFTDSLTHVVIDVPCGEFDCVTARDRLHTLRRTDDELGVVGTRYVANFAGPDNSLIGGNLNDDEFIEILDFGIFVGRFGDDYGTPDTDCDTSAPHADISGDGIVDMADYTFISTNFLAAREDDCCGEPSVAGPRDSVSVVELMRSGHEDLVIADLNADGWLDRLDVVAFLNGDRPCRADWNRDALVNSADFFSFVTAFFNGNADFNRDNVTNSQDFFDYLTQFFSGC